MDSKQIRALLERVACGEHSVEDAVSSLSQSSLEFLSHATLDHGRRARCGFEEVVYAERKSFAELEQIIEAFIARRGAVLVTRIPQELLDPLAQRFPELLISARARLAVLGQASEEQTLGSLAVVSAGTSDAPIATEAAMSAEYFGFAVTQFTDVGVAGLERLTARLAEIREHDVVIVVAGMEGALSSVLGGLVEAPIIAVPTSVGYGASLGGITTLFSMLISCSPGITVVNIDNGFGAALAAARMVRHLKKRQ